MLLKIERGIVPKSDYIDTQGMSGGYVTGEVPTEPVEYPPMPIPKRTIFTDMERKELKEIIHEVLNERECKNEDDSWLYRGTY